MKKIILFLLLISSFAYSQDFDLTANQTNGKFSLATNNTTFMGIASGSVVIPNFFDASASIDTSLWGLTPNQTNGKYSIAYNKATFMGKDSGTVVIPVYFGSNSSSSSLDTSLIPFLNQNNTFTGTVNTFSNKVVVGTGTSNGTADFLVMGDTTTIRGTVYRDSSYFRVRINPFSQRLKIEAIGKTGNNMMTWDSTLITTSLGISSTGDITGRDIYTVNQRYLGATSNSNGNQGILINSTAEGVARLRNYGLTYYATLMLGRVSVESGSNKSSGSATLSSGTVTVANTSITANSVVLLMPVGITAGGYLGVTLNAGVGFTINSSNVLDGRVVTYVIQETF